MGVLIDETTRVLIQGLPARDARKIAGQMAGFGTQVVAVVAPTDDDNESAHPVPVCPTVEEAVEAERPNATLIAASPAGVLDAALEALARGIRLLIIATTGVSRYDAGVILDRATGAAARVIGPGSAGVINPAGRVMVGTIASGLGRAFAPGQVGVIARGRDVVDAIARVIQDVGLGTSTAVDVGVDAVIGTTPAALLPLFERDRATAGVVLLDGGDAAFADDVATVMRSRRYTKPLISFGGRRLSSSPYARPFGGPSSDHDDEQRDASATILREAGALVAEDREDLMQFLSLVFKREPYFGPADRATRLR